MTNKVKMKLEITNALFESAIKSYLCLPDDDLVYIDCFVGGDVIWEEDIVNFKNNKVIKNNNFKIDTNPLKSKSSPDNNHLQIVNDFNLALSKYFSKKNSLQKVYNPWKASFYFVSFLFFMFQFL